MPGMMRFLASLEMTGGKRNDSGGGLMAFALAGTTRFMRMTARPSPAVNATGANRIPAQPPFTGSDTVKALPWPSLLSTRMLPRWAVTMLLTIASPRPVPWIVRVLASLTR